MNNTTKLTMMLGAWLLSSWAVAKPMSAEEIVKKADHEVRRTYNTQVATISLTTCKYKMTKGRMGCAEKPRAVVFENTQKHLDRNKNDSRSLAVIKSPVAEKGISLLTFEHDKHHKENDNWIFMPSMGKVNRVISSSEEPGSIFGSEFSLENSENPEARKVHEWTYTMLAEEELDGRPTFKIQMTPTKEKAQKTLYEKLIVWIDRERFTTLREDMYRDGKIHKQRLQSKIKQIQGVWVPLKAVMRNLTSKRVSQMDITQVVYHLDVKDEFLTQRSLTDFAFRERNLQDFRSQYNKQM